MRRIKRVSLVSIIITVMLFIAACGERTGKETANTKTVLTLGAISANASLKKQVDAFNKDNAHIWIEIKEYEETNIDGNDAMDMIQMEIAAGKGPDIIDFGYRYSMDAAGSGVMEDLYPFFKADEEINEEDFFTNIIHAFAVNEKLYILPPQFTIQTVAGRREDLGDAARWNISDMMGVYQKKGAESSLFPGDSQKEVFGFLCMGSMGNFVDLNKGICSFDNDLFKDLLTFSNSFPEHGIYEEGYSVIEQFLEGKALLYPVSIADVYECAKVRTIFGDSPVNFIGYPLDERSGNIAKPGNIALGINKNSKNKEAAWEFIKSFLREEYQAGIKNGIPLLKSEVEKRLEEAEKIEYDQNKVEKVKASIVFEGEDPINIACIQEQDANDFLKIIESVETAYAVDAELYSIVLEEAGYFFEDNRDLDSVIQIIQSRVSIYVSEKYNVN